MCVAVQTGDGPWDEKPSTRIIHELADQTETDPQSLPPLAGSVDPEAIDTLLIGTTEGDVQITFDHAGHQISVDSGGSLTIQPEP